MGVTHFIKSGWPAYMSLLQNKHKTIIFSTLAMNQTVFLVDVARELAKYGYLAKFITFHDRSHAYITKHGFAAHNAFDAVDHQGPVKLPSFEKTMSRYGIDAPGIALSHEQAAYEETDGESLKNKFRRYLFAMDALFVEELQYSDPADITVIQELGGFLSVQSVFYAARGRGINNFFVEPSFFRGRVFFVRNSFSAVQVPGPDGVVVKGAVREYLENTVRKQNIVVPVKDAHHYRGAVRKIIDIRNMRRLAEKSWDKFAAGKREEFQYIGGHVRRHLRMLVNTMRLRRFYRALPEDTRFVYYPLHVPADAALTLRSPEYLDQYTLIDFISRSIPCTHKVLIKEHPALVGAVSYTRMRELLARRDNVILLDPGINNYDILRASDAVLTVNSKSGAEALLLGKPVIVLGDAFYRASSLVHVVDRLGDLPKKTAEILSDQKTIGPEKIQAYFQNVWDHSFPGELYDTSPQNVADMTASLHMVLETARG